MLLWKWGFPVISFSTGYHKLFFCYSIFFTNILTLHGTVSWVYSHVSQWFGIFKRFPVSIFFFNVLTFPSYPSRPSLQRKRWKWTLLSGYSQSTGLSFSFSTGRVLDPLPPCKPKLCPYHLFVSPSLKNKWKKKIRFSSFHMTNPRLFYRR